MKDSSIPIIISFIFLMIFFSANCVYSQEGSETFKILWQKDLGCGENLSCSTGDATINEADGTLLIMGTSFSKEFSEEGFWLWEIDEKGERIGATMLDKISEDEKIPTTIRSSIKGISVSKDGNFRAIGKFGEGGIQSLLKMNLEGKNISTKSLSLEGSIKDYFQISTTIFFKNDNFLLIGNDLQGNGIIVKADAEGNKLWEKSYDMGRVENFTDGISLGDRGEFLLSGYSMNLQRGASLDPMTAASDIWIIKCNEKGDRLSEEIFTGRDPYVCRLDSDNFVVLYDKSTSSDIRDRDYRVKMFDSNLKLLLEKPIISGSFVRPFNIISVDRNRFILVGCKEGALIVIGYDGRFNKTRELTIEKGLLCSNFKVSLVEKKLFIASETFGSNREFFPNRAIKIIALQL